MRRGLVGLELVDQVEDGAIQDLEPRLDDMVADGLGQVAFAQAGRSNQQDIAALANELAGSQLINLLALDGGIKSPIEVFQGFVIAEARGFGAFLNDPLLADVEFILEDQFQELFMGQLMSVGFLQAQFQAG